MKGATPVVAAFGRVERVISIHAPVKGATAHDDLHIVDFKYDFNPRTREGCDFAAAVAQSMALAISIHAPVKGATRSRRRIA